MRFSALLTGLFFFFFAVPDAQAAGVIPTSEKVAKQQEWKIQQLEVRIEKTRSPKKQARLAKRLKKIKYGEQGDALGLAALLGGIVGILLSLAVLLFLGIEWNLLIFVGLLFGIAAIIFAIVDIRYTNMPGQAIAAMIAGGLAIVAGIIALVLVK